MEIGERLKKVREIRKMKQHFVAARMGLSTQTYCTLEKGGNLKLSTITKFCKATDISIPFLLSNDAVITEDTVTFFDSLKGESFLLSYVKLENKLKAYEQLLFKNE